ncbi:hypothetical protein JNK13_02420 [bacterium]|nr:hypothetical protein [bacterium]
MNKYKRIIAIFCAISFVLSLVPFARAENNAVTEDYSSLAVICKQPLIVRAAVQNTKDISAEIGQPASLFDLKISEVIRSEDKTIQAGSTIQIKQAGGRTSSGRVMEAMAVTPHGQIHTLNLAPGMAGLFVFHTTKTAEGPLPVVGFYREVEGKVVNEGGFQVALNESTGSIQAISDKSITTSLTYNSGNTLSGTPTQAGAIEESQNDSKEKALSKNQTINEFYSKMRCK